jgi:hypothetical protein
MLNKEIPILKEIDSSLGLGLLHAGVDPFLKTKAEPLLDVVRHSNSFPFEELGGRGPTPRSFEFLGRWPFCGDHFQEARASEQAEMLNTIKLQVKCFIAHHLNVLPKN